MNTFWWRLLHLEPLLWRTIVTGTLGTLATFGVIALPGTADALLAAVAAVTSFVLFFWARPAVTANARVVVAAPDPVIRPTFVVPGPAATRASDAAILDAARRGSLDSPE